MPHATTLPVPSNVNATKDSAEMELIAKILMSVPKNHTIAMFTPTARITLENGTVHVTTVGLVLVKTALMWMNVLKLSKVIIVFLMPFAKTLTAILSVNVLLVMQQLLLHMTHKMANVQTWTNVTLEPITAAKMPNVPITPVLSTVIVLKVILETESRVLTSMNVLKAQITVIMTQLALILPEASNVIVIPDFMAMVFHVMTNLSVMNARKKDVWPTIALSMVFAVIHMAALTVHVSRDTQAMA
jgi:hypothetical protein